MNEVKKKRRMYFAEPPLFDLALDDILGLALDYFEGLKVITKAEFAKLSAKKRWKSFTIARRESKFLIDDIRVRLVDHLKEGKAIDEFVSNIDSYLDTLGFTKLSPYHLETVFRTNSANGYGAGRLTIMNRLGDDEFPYRQVLAVGDNRTRDAHMELDGYVAEANDPVWSWLRTPFSYNCRCKISPVHIDEGLTPSGYTPDVMGKAGFDFL